MKSRQLDELRLLFSTYSPIKTNKQLIEHYNQISNTSFNHNKNIRNQYNKEILSGFLNESVIKAAFIQNYSFKESPSSTVTVFELNTGDSRADICMLNGKSMVFEIKTEYDTFVRLESQMKEYTKAYEYLNLIIPECKLQDALDSLDRMVGIITYRKVDRTISFSTVREPELNHSIDPVFQMEQLTMKQLSTLVKTTCLSKLDFVNQVVKTYSKERINRIFIDLMKDKYHKKWMYLYENRKLIKPLDYQWFFKNNIAIEAVYN